MNIQELKKLVLDNNGNCKELNICEHCPLSFSSQCFLENIVDNSEETFNILSVMYFENI